MSNSALEESDDQLGFLKNLPMPPGMKDIAR
jgi:hypothetical protein